MLPKQSLQSNGQDLVSFILFFNEKKQRRILENDGLWTLAFSVKGGEAKFLVFCNQIGGNRRPLVLWP
jgi:hypothetical protein